MINFIKNRKKKYYRSIIRGYFLIRKSNNPNLISEIKCDLTNLKLNVSDSDFSKFIPKINSIKIEIILRQFILKNLLDPWKINKYLLIYFSEKKSKLRYPLPIDWVVFLKKKNIDVSFFFSKLLLLRNIFFEYLKGFLNFFKIIFFENFNNDQRLYVQFSDIIKDQFPVNQKLESYDLISWNIIKNNVFKNVSVIKHNIKNNKIIYIKDKIIYPYKYLLPSLNFYRRIKFIFWFLVFFIDSVFLLFRGKWYSSILFSEIILLKKVDEIDKKYLAKEYLFSNSQLIYRPMWTYIAQLKGSKITFYNYSSSFLGFKINQKYTVPELGYQSMTWENILLWSKEYSDYTKKCCPNLNIKLVSPIYNTDTNYNIPKFKKNIISVFDISPLRFSARAELCPDDNYRILSNSIQFFNDIYKSCIGNNFIIIIKFKRSFNSKHNPHYIDFLINDFTKRENVFLIPPNVSPFRLIKLSKASIHIPFTSTALISDYLNVPSVYYDPTSTIQNDDRGSQGIELVKGFVSLDNWLKKISI
jgi:polysaccharide biosynthesis PFTS motif protein